MISIDFSQAVQIVGFAALSVFGFYALRLVTSFRTGILARSWKHVTTGAMFLIVAEIPLLLASVGLSATESTILAVSGMLMRLIGIIFLTIGLRIQCQVWRREIGPRSPRANPIPA